MATRNSRVEIFIQRDSSNSITVNVKNGMIKKDGEKEREIDVSAIKFNETRIMCGLN